MTCSCLALAACLVAASGARADQPANAAVHKPAGSVSDDVVWRLRSPDSNGQTQVECFGCHARMLAAGKREGPVVFRYDAVRSEVAGFVVKGLALPAEARSLRMEVKPSSDTSLAFNLVEEGGAVYQAFVWLPGGEWSLVEMPLKEFWLAENCTDTDGRLTLAAVRELRVLDLANLPGQVGRALGLKDGPQEMVVKRLEISTKAVRGRSKVEDERAVVDELDGPPFFLLPIGGPRLDYEEVDGRRALAVEYVLGRYRWAGIVRGVAHLPVERAQAVSFEARARPSVRVHVVAEERDGSKYFTAVMLPSWAGWKTFRVALSEMALVQGSEDENGKLDAGQLRVVIIVADTFSTPLSPGGRGKLWLRRLGLELSQPRRAAGSSEPDGP